jgi:TRAP transporter TAXI family solute receptor
MFKKALGKTILAASIGLSAISAQAVDISMEAATAQSVVGLMPQTMASYLSKADVNVQLAMGQTLTKSLLKIANGSLDSSVIPPGAYLMLKAGKGPYAKMGAEKGAEMATSVRALYGFPGSTYHAITWADNGINEWKDAAGKRVYIGPPAGAANAQITSLAAAGGLEKDTYEGIKAPWGAAAQAFQDGQFDVYVGSFPVGSQVVAELSLKRPIRILGIPAGTQPKKGLGMEESLIPAGTYPDQANTSDSTSFLTLMFIGVNASMSDDLAYTMTKVYMETREQMGKDNRLLNHLSKYSPFTGVTAPLHPGAIKYFEENGFTVPADLK